MKLTIGRKRRSATAFQAPASTSQSLPVYSENKDRAREFPGPTVSSRALSMLLVSPSLAADRPCSIFRNVGGRPQVLPSPKPAFLIDNADRASKSIPVRHWRIAFQGFVPKHPCANDRREYDCDGINLLPSKNDPSMVKMNLGTLHESN
jgi:hypothetical protein